MVNFKNKYAMIIFTIPEKEISENLKEIFLFIVKTRFDKFSGLINFILRNFTLGK
jgi:hypothetical protein